MQEIGFIEFNIDQLREGLRKMTDGEWRKFGRAAANMVSPKANLGKPPDEAVVIQLEEAWAEMAEKASGEIAQFCKRSLKLQLDGEERFSFWSRAQALARKSPYPACC